MSLKALELRVPPVVVAAVCAGLMWLAARVAPGLAVDVPGREVVVPALALLGTVVAFAGLFTVLRASTTIHPSRPEEASTLVTSGIYRFTRNPMYLGLFFVLLAAAVELEHPLALVVAVLFVPYMTRFQIRPEERALRARFGEAFESYVRRTRRWL